MLEAVTFTTNLEHIGDIIDKGLLPLAAKKQKQGLRLLRRRLARHPRLSRADRRADAPGARGLRVARHPRSPASWSPRRTGCATRRRVPPSATSRRLRDGLPETIETSALHLDVLRDLKRINAHLTTVAYPILEQTGELSGSRLRAPAPHPPPAPRRARSGRPRLQRRVAQAERNPRVAFSTISAAQSPWLPNRGSRIATATA